MNCILEAGAIETSQMMYSVCQDFLFPHSVKGLGDMPAKDRESEERDNG